MRDTIGSGSREINRTIKLYLAFFITKVSRQTREIRNQRRWLIGSMSGKAHTDNSAALHKYIIQNCPNINVYWVINRDSPDVDKARQIGPVLYREDLWTYVYGLLAQVHIISHGLADVPTCGSSLSSNAVKVRLGHGLTALKRTKGSLLRSVAAKNRVFNLVPVSSELEKQHKHNWGIDREKIVVTGLPRFDVLLGKRKLCQCREGSGTPAARILYMPTWRDWLPRGRGEFVETDFYRQVGNFLLHPGLNEFLARHQVVLDVHFHIITRHHFDAIGQEIARMSHVKTLPPEEDLQDAIVRSRLLITDYSSVAWDFLYLDKPVLFYQFDVDKFNKARGAYIDLQDLFGPIARDADRAVELTRHFVERDFDCADYRAKMERWQRQAFQYRDDANCERVVRAIFDRLGDQGK